MRLFRFLPSSYWDNGGDVSDYSPCLIVANTLEEAWGFLLMYYTRTQRREWTVDEIDLTCPGVVDA